MTDTPPQGIAIIGMAGRFPGADNIDDFWANILDKKQTVTHFDADQDELGTPDPDQGPYVRARGILDDIDKFDAAYFGYLPNEAAVMDPQHRVFLEICHEALEHGGQDPARYKGATGVFGGCYLDTYLLHNIASHPERRRKMIEQMQVGTLQVELGNDKDYLATRVAFKLGLTGPAITLQTACSTSLVAIVTACQSLETYGCDMAVAGGVTIVLPQYRGYHYKEGGMLSPDGRCRPFDAQAAGTVFSNGAAVLLLKRLEDAIKDRDTVYGVIEGYATNNDGAGKLSYTAPSVDGQAEVISLALGMSGLTAQNIGAVEAHGTATPVGDPIEVNGLVKGWGANAPAQGTCALGSVKANLGHLDVASGAIGTIKTALSLYHGVIPPQIHYSAPNPELKLEDSPFRIVTEQEEWPTDPTVKAATVSSFGVGGTNAHIVVTRPPVSADQTPSTTEKSDPVLIPLSAKNSPALQALAADLADHLSGPEASRLIDCAYTYQVGRTAHPIRTAIVADGKEGAIKALETMAKRTFEKPAEATELIFVFAGQGSQAPGMAHALYMQYTRFKETFDDIFAVFGDIDQEADALFQSLIAAPTDDLAASAGSALQQTAWAQPAIFAYQVSMLSLLKSVGVHPSAVIGHSIGEFAAAVAAGVFDIQTAARMVWARGAAMQAAMPGVMVAIPEAAEVIRPRLTEGVDLAAINGETLTVIGGDEDDVEAWGQANPDLWADAKRLHTSHAFHTQMMRDAAEHFAKGLAPLPTPRPTDSAFFSTVTGACIDDEQLARPAYWHDQILSPVNFLGAVQAAAEAHPHTAFVDIGPATIARAMMTDCLPADRIMANLSPSPKSLGEGQHTYLSGIGDLWRHGIVPNWDAISPADARRVPVPTYPFQKKRHWIDPAPDAMGEPSSQDAPSVTPTATPPAAAASTEATSVIQQQMNIMRAQLALLNDAGESDHDGI